MKTITRGLAVIGALVVGWVVFSYVRVKLERARAALVEEETPAEEVEVEIDVPPDADVR